MKKTNELLSTILADGPSPSTLLIICRNLKEEGLIKDALRACIKGLSLYPGDIRLRRLLSECYLELGFISMAEKEMALVVEQIQELIPVFRTQADLLERQGRHEEAILALEKYLLHFPDDTEALDRLRALKPEEVPAFPPKAPSPEEIVPADIATHTLAEIYESQGQIQAAIDTYKKLIDQDPGDVRAQERFRALQAEVHGEEEIPSHRQRKTAGLEKTIGILENWLTKVQEMGSAQ